MNMPHEMMLRPGSADRTRETYWGELMTFLEAEVRPPAPTEVRIKVKAIGINRAESMWRTDAYIEPVAKFPAGLGV